MGVRESLNKHPAVVAGAALTMLVVAVAASALSLRETTGLATKAYFSADDGKTFFVDDTTKLVPFDHGGKQAVRAVVYRCGSGQPFVGYLVRYSDETKSKIVRMSQDPQTTGEASQLRATGGEVKRPGDEKWVPMSSPKGEQIVMNPKCPDGNTAMGIAP